ncbi:MAG: hypothetical protein Q8P18_15020 [Pseudomonadota bacterium]|nr:hypothetical protein [Pseudomonadota bacterium]
MPTASAAPSAILAAHGLHFAALGSAAALPHLDLAPLGVPTTFLDAAREPGWVERYHAVNLARFGGPLALPGWVLADLYLLPSAIGLVLDGDAIVAAYYAAPSLEPGTVIGVSLLSLREGIGAGYAVKALTLAMYRARVQRGITQWRSRALRVHTRFGPLVVEGPAPAVHGAAAESFVYRVILGAPSPSDAAPMPIPEAIARTNAGERLTIVGPGLHVDGEHVWVARAPLQP